ncbi:MAG: proton-conducting transporter membrane subunit [Pirellulales bacterium]
MLTAVAGDLVLLFLGLELVSIPTYLLLLVARRDALGEEAGAKYFFLSLLASALFLYGLSFLYGIAGSTALADVRAALAARADGAGLPQLAPLALVLLIAGLGFRLAVVPFHFYAPDVFEGSTHPNAGFLSIVPKIVGVVGVVRLVVAAMPGTETLAWQVTLTLAVLTMTLGNVVALWQENVRRMLAYSSIAHAGYILIGLAVALGTAGGWKRPPDSTASAPCCSISADTPSHRSARLLLAYLSQGGHTTERVEHLAGLARRQPTMAVVIALAMFSLAGIPPLAGFAGKFTLLASAVSIDSTGPNAAVVHNWFLALVTIALVNAAIAAAYYLRVVKVIFFDPAPAIVATEKGKMPESRERSGLIAAVVCAVLIVGLGLFLAPC